MIASHLLCNLITQIAEISEISLFNVQLQSVLERNLLATGIPVQDLTIGQASAICHDSILSLAPDTEVHINGDHE